MNEEHKQYLDELRDSGETNMYGASSYLVVAFPELTNKEAKNILLEWMQSFNE